MNNLLRSAVAVLGLTALTACGDSNEPRGLRLQDMAGAWKATKIQVTDLATSETEEWLSAGYIVEFRMTLGVSGALSFISIAEEGAEPVVTNGTLVLEGHEVTITVDGGVLNGTVTLIDDELTINFPDDGGLRFVMVFQRI